MEGRVLLALAISAVFAVAFMYGMVTGRAASRLDASRKDHPTLFWTHQACFAVTAVASAAVAVALLLKLMPA